MKNNKKIVFSGIQPSGNLHLGNYLGAISQWVDMQDQYQCIFCVVDLHAITVKQDPKILNQKISEVARIYLASGIDPQKSVIFQQSDVKEHTELAWILNTVTRMSDLNKMTQFKSKAGLQFGFDNLENILNYLTHNKKLNHNDALFIGNSKNDKNRLEIYIKNILHKFNSVGVGLFDYPVLMAADILLYNTDIVPVGDDQVQHVELTRTLARRFNTQFKEVFKIPEAQIKKEGARIMGLDDPTKKMSKSAASEANYIALTDDPDIAKKKIMRATTDSEGLIKFNQEKKPGISNLLNIYSILTGKKITELEKSYLGKGYGDLKKDLAEIVAEFLNDFQTKYNKISDKDVKEIMKTGAEKARPMAEETAKKVKRAIGIN